MAHLSEESLCFNYARQRPICLRGAPFISPLRASRRRCRRETNHIEAASLCSLTTVKFSQMPHGAAPDRQTCHVDWQMLGQRHARIGQVRRMACMLRVIEFRLNDKQEKPDARN
jgi:hypothetical protein